MPQTDAERDDSYRAVGRYVVEFSRLVLQMRHGIEGQLTRGEDDSLIAAIALGEAFANQITEAFFAICEHVADLDEEERQVGVRLRKEVRDEVKRRNDFAHGDWAIGKATFGDHPTLSRVKPGRKDGARQRKPLPMAEIDAAADQVHALRQKVVDFGAVCLSIFDFERRKWGEGPIRVRDVLRRDGYEVVRLEPVQIEWL